MNTPTDGAEPYDQFVDEDDFQLMEWLGTFADDDPDYARQAWAVLYRRHAPFLLAAVHQTARDAFGDAAAAEDVVAETFKKVYEKAGTFNPPTQPMDGPAQRGLFRGWLSTIAVNVIRDAQRKQQQVHARHIEQDHWADIEDVAPVTSSDTAWISRVMNDVLDDREQDILRTTYRYYDPSTGNTPKLPSDELHRLCEEHAITPENLRQIRRRALAKLSEALQRSRKAG